MWVEVSGLSDGCSWAWLGIDDGSNGILGQIESGLEFEPTLFIDDLNFCIDQQIDASNPVQCN